MSSGDEYADDGALLIHDAFPKCKAKVEPDTERGGFAPEAQDGGCAPEDPIKSESEQDQEDDPKTKVLRDCQRICDIYGGPAQYLARQFPTIVEREAFSAQLRRLCPPSELVAYWAPGKVIHNGMRIHLHPASLGWSASASTKPLPYPKTFLALADEFLAHSFLTAEEPLRVWVPPDVGGAFCLHFVKGMARTCSLLCLSDLVSRIKTGQHDFFVSL